MNLSSTVPADLAEQRYNAANTDITQSQIDDMAGQLVSEWAYSSTLRKSDLGYRFDDYLATELIADLDRDAFHSVPMQALRMSAISSDLLAVSLRDYYEEKAKAFVADPAHQTECWEKYMTSNDE